MKINPDTLEIPADLDEAVSQLMVMIPPHHLQTLKLEELDRCGGLFHHGLGMHLRNAWGLHGSETPISQHLESLGIIHGDDKSCTIFRALWHRLNKKPFDISKDIELYRAHWAEYGLDMLGAPREKGGRR